MKILHELKNKTWIEWIKIIVAIDIASVGIGLIIGMDSFHILADMLGVVTHVIFGILYLFVATLIFKRVFPLHLFEDESPADVFNKNIDTITHTTEKIISKGKDFAKKRYNEARDEFEKMSQDQS